MPFVVLKYAGRCGSHWLNSCLRSHPCIFSPKVEQFDVNSEYWQDTSRWKARIDALFDPLGRDGAHGCLVKANTFDAPLWRELRLEIARLPDLKVIFNHRRDLLAQFVSLVVADTSSRWSSYMPPIASAPLEIGINGMLSSFERWERTNLANAEIFAGLPSMTFDYEDLEEDLGGTLAKVYEFLGVDAGHIPTYETKKQRFMEARDMIINFPEVQEALRSSKWAEQLQEYL